MIFNTTSRSQWKIVRDTISTTWASQSDDEESNVPIQMHYISDVKADSIVIVRPVGHPTSNVEAFQNAGIYLREVANGIVLISRLGNANESEIEIEFIVVP